MASMKAKLGQSPKQQQQKEFVPGAPAQSQYRSPNIPTNDSPKAPTK